jgi:RHS repeat-associated protein
MLSGDFNGDGRTDLQFNTSFANAPLQVTEAIKKVTTGLGATTDIVYGALTDASVYTKAGGTVGSRGVAIQSPLYVVKATTASTATAGTFNTSYSYSGLVGDTTGRGLLGFAQRVATQTVSDDSAYLVKTISDNSQTWPSAGRPSKVSQVVGPAAGAASRTVKETSFAWSTRETARGALKTHEVHLTNKTEKSFELNGDALSWAVTATPLANIDASTGDVGLVETYTTDAAGTADGYKKQTTSTYQNDLGNWIIGRVATTTVTSFLPDRTSATRKSAFTYYQASDGAKVGLLKTETIEPDLGGNLTVTTLHEYDTFGNRASSSASFVENGATRTRTTTTSFDSLGRFIQSVTNALGHVETRTHDERFGGVKSATSPTAITAATTFDNFGRKVSELVTDGSGRRLGQTTWTLASASPSYSYSVRTQTSSGGETTSYFDNLQRELRVDTRTFSGGTASATSAYDSKGRKVNASRPYASTGGSSVARATTWLHDAMGRVTEEADRQGDAGSAVIRKTTTAYQKLSEQDLAFPGTSARPGLLVTVTRTNDAGSGGNQVTSQLLNSQGQAIRVRDANARDTRFAFDPFGNLVCVTPPGVATSDYRCATRTGLQVKTVYDARGRKSQLQDPDTGTWGYNYNGLGELTNQYDANGNTTLVSYDDLGRMTGRTVGIHSTTFGYDYCKLGKACSVSVTGGASRSFEYDAQARQTAATLQYAGKTFTSRTLYDTEGRVSFVSYPGDDLGNGGLGLRQSYNAYGFMTSVADTASPSTTYWAATARYDDGQAYQSSLAGYSVTRGYDSLGRPQSIGSGSVTSQTFAFDQVGNLTARSDSAAGYGETFSYDVMNRVTASTCPLPCNGKTAAYDDYGNVTSRSDRGGYTYHPNTHRVSAVNGKTYGYDANGNLTTVNGASYATWTPFNMPATLGTGALGYAYDGAFTRVKETSQANGTTYYATPGFFEQVEVGGIKVLRHYVASPEGPVAVVNIARDNNGLEMSRSRTITFADHLGSTIAEVNAATGAVTRLSFDAWGKRRLSTGADGNPVLTGLASERGFTGHEMLDEVGLVHMNGRIYDPAIGRFLSADPIIQSPLDLQNYNRYSYVLNNPLSLTDPTGYSWWTKWRRPILAVVAAVVTYNLSSVAMSSAAIKAGSSTALATVGTASNGMLVGTGLTATGNAVAGAAAGFASGGVMGGNLESAVRGAFSGAAFGGLNGWFGNSWSIGRVGANTALGGAISKAMGGRFSDGARLALVTSFAQWGMHAMANSTDTLKAAECMPRSTCYYDPSSGRLDTIGTRTVHSSVLDSGSYWNAHPVKAYLAGANGKGLTMGEEGIGPHFYDSWPDPLRGVAQTTWNSISKVHDFANSWNYDWRTGLRVEGGPWGNVSAAAAANFEILMNAYSFSTMLPTAGYALFSTAGPYFASTYLDGRHR